MIILILLLSPLVLGHGKLITPTSRGGTGYENNPVGAPNKIFTATQEVDWVCRHDYDVQKPIQATWQAGDYAVVSWHNSARHIGDCELFLSPDFDSPREDMRWFKIANYHDCKQHSQKPVNVYVPSWIPQGRYVLRWGWYALHNWPDQLEFFVQCADILIQSAATSAPAELQMYKLLDPTPLYPYSGQRVVEGVGLVNNYRYPFPPSTETFQTGPSCALCWTLANCELDGKTSIQNGCENSVSNTFGFLWPVGVVIDGFVDVFANPPQIDYCGSHTCATDFLLVSYANSVPCDGSCNDETCCVPKILGCTNPAANNFNPGSNFDDGSCILNVVTQATVPVNADSDLYDQQGVYHGCSSGIFKSTSKVATHAWCQADCVWSWNHCKGHCACRSVVAAQTTTQAVVAEQSSQAVGDCPDGTWVSTSVFTNDAWCEGTCAVNVETCTSNSYCACSTNIPVDPNCPSGDYTNKDARATKSWCMTNCQGNWNHCSVYCKCGDGTVATTGQTPTATTNTQTTAQTATTNTQATAQTNPTATTDAQTTGQVNPTIVIDDALVQQVVSRLQNSQSDDVFMYETPTEGWKPSTIYLWNDMITAVQTLATEGVAGLKLWMSDPSSPQVNYGLVNIAAFLANAMQETIRYNACDENNWSGNAVTNQYGGVTYSAANACGQAQQSYQDYVCTAQEDEIAGGKMACDVDVDMEMRAFTQAEWYGAPAKMFCAPRSKIPKAPRWSYTSPWCDGSQDHFPAGADLDSYFEYVMQGGSCRDYEGIKTGGWTFEGEGCTSEGCANSAAPLFGQQQGRTDVEGCCWWGRGVIQTTGVCNFGKLNFYLGKRAHDEGRHSLYPTIDFCRNPNAICDPASPPDLKWVAGFFYWLNAVQTYDQGGWNYLDELQKWVNQGMQLQDTSFINGASGIVNRGCHNPPNCGTGNLHGGNERRANFENVLRAMHLI